MMSIVWVSLWVVPMIDSWALWYVHIMIVIVIGPDDWQMSTCLWHDVLWLSLWLTDEHCDMMSILWLSLWFVPMIGRWALWYDVHNYYDCHCDCPHDWQMSTVIWCPYCDCHCDCPHDWQMIAGSGDSSVVRAPGSWSKGCGFKSLLERRENFLLQGQLSVLTLIRYPFHPRVTAVARKRPLSFCQKCRWQVTAKHAYTLCTWLCMKWHGACLYGVRRTRRDWLSLAADSCGTSHASAVSTPLRWIFKNAL